MIRNSFLVLDNATEYGCREYWQFARFHFSFDTWIHPQSSEMHATVFKHTVTVTERRNRRSFSIWLTDVCDSSSVHKIKDYLDSFRIKVPTTFTVLLHISLSENLHLLPDPRIPVIETDFPLCNPGRWQYTPGCLRIDNNNIVWHSVCLDRCDLEHNPFKCQKHIFSL